MVKRIIVCFLLINRECYSMYHAMLEASMQAYYQCYTEKEQREQARQNKLKKAAYASSSLKISSCWLFRWKVSQDAMAKSLTKPRSKL